MATYTRLTKLTNTLTKIPKANLTTIGRFAIGVFGKARFGKTDIFTKIVKGSNSYVKITKDN